MNVYFLVEGMRTEKKAYPKILKYYKPHYKYVQNYFEIEKNSFYIESGLGMPQLLSKIYPAMLNIKDQNQTENKFDILVISIDSDIYGGYKQAKELLQNQVEQDLIKAELKINIVCIIQNPCIETWFLGNRSVYPQKIKSPFKDFHKNYNVCANCPEKMYPPKNSNYTLSKYHLVYLKTMLKQSNLRYEKNYVDNVTTNEYINALDKRINKTNHLPSLRTFINFINTL